MEAAFPPLLSGLAEKLLRRPPSLRELVTIIGYADDYAWFGGLVRRLFPNEAEEALSAPDVRTRVERFARLFTERHFPLYSPYFEFLLEDGDEPSWTWLRRGIPFDLMGFGYDGLHEMWGYHRDGISALALLVRVSDAYYDGPDGLRTAWLESASGRIPKETLQRIPQGGIPVETLAEAVMDTRFEGAAQPCSHGFSPRPATSSSTTATTMARSTASQTPGTTTSSPRAHRSGKGQTPSWTRWATSPNGWRRTFRPASPRCWISSCPGSPNTTQGKEDDDHDQ